MILIFLISIEFESGVINDLKKAIEVAEIVCKRRRVSFGDVDKDLLTSVYNLTLKNRWL